MARRPAKPRAAPDRSQWTATYRKRVEGWEARHPGQTYGAAARGHKPREHIERAKRERAKRGGITRAEEERARAWFQRHNKHGRTAAGWQSADDLVDWIKIAGYDDFRVNRFVWNKVSAKYLKDVAAGTYKKGDSKYSEMLQELLDDMELPPEAFRHYHP